MYALELSPYLLLDSIIILFFSIKGISVTPVIYVRKNSIIQNNIIALLLCKLREVRRYDYYTGYYDKNFPLRVKSLTSYLDFVRMKTPPSDDVQPQSDIYFMIHLYTRFLSLIYHGFPFYISLTSVSNEWLNVWT
jgi:hypothetical protein